MKPERTGREADPQPRSPLLEAAEWERPVGRQEREQQQNEGGQQKHVAVPSQWRQPGPADGKQQGNGQGGGDQEPPPLQGSQGSVETVDLHEPDGGDDRCEGQEIRGRVGGPLSHGQVQSAERGGENNEGQCHLSVDAITGCQVDQPDPE